MALYNQDAGFSDELFGGIVQRLLAMTLVMVAFGATLLVSRTVFERLPHLEDELAYVYQAQVFARGNIVLQSPDPHNPYWKPFVVNYSGNRFSKYTPGWSLLLAPGVLMGFTPIINALFSALAIALTYRMSEEVFNADTGVIAALLMTFSPMFLLLGGSLMGHTAALACAMWFVYSYWRLEQKRRVLWWGLAAGFGLGLLTVNRPLTGIAISTPFVIYSGMRLGWVLIRQRALFWKTLYPLLALGGVTIIIGMLIPVYRFVATSNPFLNTYTLVWEYDKVGFGPDHGRIGHTWKMGWDTALDDLTLTAADMYGWQLEPFSLQQRDHLLRASSAYPGTGISYVLLPLGLIVGLLFSRQRRWTLLLAIIPLSIIIFQMAYWIGSQRYSTRYYFEGLAAATILSAILPGWIAHQRGRWVTYLVFVGITVVSMNRYTIERLSILHGFNGVTQARVAEVMTQRETVKPTLVILTGNDMTWRANGTLMALTNAHLDSDIILARDRGDQRYRERILAQFPDREVIDMRGEGSRSWFVGQEPLDNVED